MTKRPDARRALAAILLLAGGAAACDLGAAPGADAAAAGPEAGGDSGGDAGIDAGEPEPCPGALPELDGNTPYTLERLNFAGFTEVRVTFCNPLYEAPLDELLFFVSILDHSGVPPSDLVSWTRVVTGAGLEVSAGFAWNGGDLGVWDHHVSGWLTGPMATAAGEPLLAPGAGSLELDVDGIGDGSTPVFFIWTQEYLP